MTSIESYLIDRMQSRIKTNMVDIKARYTQHWFKPLAVMPRKGQEASNNRPHPRLKNITRHNFMLPCRYK